MGRASHYIRTLIADLAGAYRLTADLRSFRRLAGDFVWFRMARIIKRQSSNRESHITTRGGFEIYYRQDRSDIYTIHEVWIEEMYRLPVPLKPEVIVDLGANIGLTSLWLAEQYGCRRLIAVEPSAANARLARLNLSRNGIEAEVLEAAVGAVDGVAIFDRGPGATNGRVISEAHPGDATSTIDSQTPVRMLSMASVLGRLAVGESVDLMKIDIEGGEQGILTDDVTWLQRVAAIIIEFHPQLIDYCRLVATLENAHFERRKQMVSNSDGNMLEFFINNQPNK